MTSWNYFTQGPYNYSTQGSLTYSAASSGMSASTAGMYGSAITAFGSGITSLIASNKQAKAMKAWQSYQNQMVNLSNAANQDAITTNEILYNKASAENAKNIQLGGMQAEGSAEVSAASAGVKGKSVDVSLAHIKGNAAYAENQRQREFIFKSLGFDVSRKTSALSGQMMMDLSDYSISSASQWASMFNTGSKIASILGAY